MPSSITTVVNKIITLKNQYKTKSSLKIINYNLSRMKIMYYITLEMQSTIESTIIAENN